MTFKPQCFSTTESRGDSIVSRVQIPLILSYGMTIHKSQSLTLNCVRVVLSSDMSEGQLYTAVSRVRRKDDLEIVVKAGCSWRSCLKVDLNVIRWLKNVLWKRLVQ